MVQNKELLSQAAPYQQTQNKTRQNIILPRGSRGITPLFTNTNINPTTGTLLLCSYEIAAKVSIVFYPANIFEEKFSNRSDFSILFAYLYRKRI